METLANSIALITKYYDKGWDEVYKRESFASMLADETGSRVKFSLDNAKVVKVAKLTLGGLSDYDRNNIETGSDEGIDDNRGYKKAAAALKWETRELTQDRGAKYTIELMDDEETSGLAVASTTKEINRTQVVPEVDAYCFSAIAAYMSAHGTTTSSAAVAGNYANYAISANTEFAELNKGIKWLDDAEVPENNRICFVSTAFMKGLRSSSELIRRLDVQKETDNKVSFKVVNFEGIPLVQVPPRRFNTGFTKLPYGGYKFGASAAAIDFILMDKNAAAHVVKYNKLKVLTGEAALANSDMDSVVLFVRIYHDVIIFDNSINGIYVHVGGYDQSPLVKYNFSASINADGVVDFVQENPEGDLLRYYLTTRDSLPSVGDSWVTNVSTESPFDIGTAFTTAGTYHIVAVRGGQVVRVKNLVISGSQGAFTYTLADNA